MNARHLGAVAVAAALLTSAACAAPSKPAPPSPRPPDSATASGSSAPSAGMGGVPSALALTRGQGFDASGAFVPQMTCDDPHDYSPGLTIGGLPPGTAELALSMVDLTDRRIHWLQLGIPAGTTALTAHHLVSGAREALNDLGEATYDGPCPPHGETHQYQLALYALPEAVPASFGKDTPPRRTLQELRSRALGSTQFVASYTRR
ncbi:YbhB/YbcL family Raf kinase inhibitor-like protein [Kitasatospora sp. NPDC088346]|uniref:YbhB/YbcL family Raf kinase inhibitor-like protein n=1 Tax=Kitasatospora sp. NPDC088346 TaxID=3364073 RepID=UPI0038181753